TPPPTMDRTQSVFFSAVTKTIAESLLALSDTERKAGAFLPLLGLNVTNFSLDAELDGEFKWTSNCGTTIYRSKKSSGRTNLDGSTTLIFTIRTGGYREILVKMPDGSFQVQNVTNCPEQPPALLLELK
ncbi:MAG: hypothetical protein AAB323_00925, partial [Pseudomonadota bacterium]